MNAVRRPATLAFLVVLALATAAAAQHEGLGAAGPDVPGGPAAVVGRLVHDTRPDATAEVDVLLYALGADGSGGLRQARTDAEGGFRFDGVSNAPDVVYLVGARSGGVPFGSRFSFAEGELEHRVTVELSDPVADAGAARHAALDLRVERGCTHLRVSHSHTVENPGDRVVHVPEGGREGAAPIFEVVLPAGAEGFEAMQGSDGLVRDGDRVRFYGPVYPGTQQVEFGYGLATDTPRFEIGLPGGVPGAAVLVPEGVLGVRSDALSPAPPLELDAQRYAVQRSDAIAPGGALALELSLAEVVASPLRTPRAEMWLELDDASLEVNERLEVVVEEAGGLPESLGQPLLCLPLPPGAMELRFSGDTMRAGLRRDPSGDLAIHGPLPPGSLPLAISYRIPSTGAGATLRRRWDREVSLLSVLIADNGVVPETTRLHRRRHVRSDERLFQHLEAFGIEPLEPVEIDLRRTPPRGGEGGWAASGFAVLSGLAALGFLVGPLRENASAASADPARAPEAPDTELAERERDAFVRALEDLDHDLETGKLSAEDHAAMRNELRTRAAAALLQPEAPKAAPAPARSDACSACGHATHPDDVFCAKCGVRLAGAGPPA